MYKIKDLGEISRCFGLEIIQNRASQTLTISQKSYTFKLIDEYLRNSNQTDLTPIDRIQTFRKAKQNEP